MIPNLTIATVFGAHGILGATVVLVAFAAGSRGLAPGIVTGLAGAGAVIIGEVAVGQELLAVSLTQMKLLITVAAAGAALGIVLTALVFEPGTPDSTDTQSDPTTYTNR